MEQHNLCLISRHCNMSVSFILCCGTVMNRVIIRLQLHSVRCIVFYIIVFLQDSLYIFLFMYMYILVDNPVQCCVILKCFLFMQIHILILN
jgi:hypothetical protein